MPGESTLERPLPNNLDAERSVVWNMGAIAAHAADKNGGDAALALFRSLLLASSAIPGGFPPVLIDVEANGKQFQEMHVDGGVGGQFFVAPPAVMAKPLTLVTVSVSLSASVSLASTGIVTAVL